MSTLGKVIAIGVSAAMPPLLVLTATAWGSWVFAIPIITGLFVLLELNFRSIRPQLTGLIGSTEPADPVLDSDPVLIAVREHARSYEECKHAQAIEVIPLGETKPVACICTHCFQQLSVGYIDSQRVLAWNDSRIPQPDPDYEDPGIPEKRYRGLVKLPDCADLLTPPPALDSPVRGEMLYLPTDVRYESDCQCLVCRRWRVPVVTEESGEMS